MWFRFVGSTAVASCFDSFIFGFLAFYGTMPIHDLIIFNATMWLIKVTIEVLGLPLSLSLARQLKRAEGLDMYDVGTKFSLFSLEAKYLSINNRYQ